VDKRTVVAIVLIVLILILTPWYLRLVSGPPQEPPEQEEAVSPEDVEEEEKLDVSAPEDKRTIAVSNLKELQQRSLTVESEFIRGTIDTKGAVLTKWEIKPRLKDPEEQKWVQLLPTVVQTGALSLSFPGNGGEVSTDDLIFESKDESLVLNAAKPLGTITLTAEAVEGLRVVKELSFHWQKHSIAMRVRIEGADELQEGRQYTLWWKPGLRDTEEKRKDDLRSFAAHAMLGDVKEKIQFRGNAIKDSSFTGDTKWLAIQTKYFLMALIPPKGVDGLGVKVRGWYQQEDAEKDLLEQRVIGAGINMPLKGGMCDHSWEIYVGPMDYFVLKDYHLGLEQMVSLGFKYIRWIGLIILQFFVKLHQIIPNYGAVIIIFSIIIKILFYPLTRKSFESMEKMRDLQPKISELREKYKTDPAKLNRATMELYRKYKVNPVSGCFPMLLQMPVFFALFRVFTNTIELRGENFLWIKDLSAPDTLIRLPWEVPIYGDAFNLLPIIMAVTMFIQQKISMKDPKQATMVYLMPIFLFFLFNKFSSGLVLYWTMFNVLTILQEQLRHRHKVALEENESEDSSKKG
jgi:YidC/Oxa1 family membrane protein insertase